MYEWRGPNGYFSTTQIPPVINNATVDDDGVYSLTIKRGVCQSQPANVVVTVRPQPQTPNLSLTGGRCEGDTVTLRMNVPNASVYRWIEPTGATRTTATNELMVDNVTVDLSGPWRGFVTQGGCDSELSDPLQVVINANPMLAVSANPNPICEGEDLQLNASPTINGAIYEWTGPDSYFAVGQSPLVNNIRANRTGTYECKITTSAGCINTQTVDVNVKQNVRVTGVSNTASSECFTSPTDVELFVTVFPPDDGSYTYEWIGPNDYTSRDSIATIPNATEDDSGDYSVFVSTGNDCSSSTETTTVKITDAPATPAAPLLSETTQPPFCEGEVITLSTTAYSGTTVEYIWSTPVGTETTIIPTLTINDANINNDGEYAVSVRIDGCESRLSGTIPIDINVVPEILAVSNSPVCEGEQLTLEADFIEGATYRWEGPGGLTSSSTNPTFPNALPSIHSGTFRVRAKVNGCESPTATTEVLVNAVPRTPTVVNNGPVCIDAPAANLRLAVPAVSSTANATYTWFDQDLNIIADEVPDLIFNLDEFENYGEGDYQFTATATANGCVSERSDPTMASFRTIPNNTAFAGEDLTLCEANVLDLDAAAPTIGFGVWQQVDGDTSGIVIANPDDPKTTIFGIEKSGIYIFEWQLSNGACEAYSTDSMTISVNPSGIANAGVDIDTCRITSLRLNAENPLAGRGRWVQPEVQRALGVMIEDVFDANTNVTGLQGGNQYFFTWEVLDGACGDAADEVVVVVSNGFSYAGEDFNDCGDGCVNLDATEPTSGVGNWESINQNITFNSTTDPGTLACDLAVGENVFVWTADNGACGDLSRDTVIVNYQPLALAKNDTININFAGTAELDVTENDNLVSPSFTITVMDVPNNGTIESLGDGIFRYQADGSFAGTDGFSYELCTAGCECSLAEVRINVGATEACDIPSIFTPNEDGINDSFIIPCLNDDNTFMNSELVIFNQWGDEVFSSQNYQNDWRGTYNSEDLPDGTYYYTLRFDDGSSPLSGYVLIQR
jgi:gliding motility-associated-like protein